MLPTILLSLWLQGTTPLPLSLDSCQALARRNAYSRAARLQVQAEEGALQSTRASLWPTLEAQAGYVYNSYVQSFTQRMIVGFDPATGRPLFREIPLEFGQHHTYQVAFNLQYPLFTWGRLRNLVAAQEAQVQAQRLQAQQTEEQMALTAGQLYLNLLVLRSGLAISQELLENLKTHEALVRERYEAGLATHLEHLQAQVQRQNAETQYHSLQSTYRSLQDQLREFLDLPDSVLPEPSDSLTPPALPPLDHYQQQVRDRLDLALLQTQRRQLDALYQATDNSNKPSLVFQASYLIRKPQGFEGTWGSSYTLTLGFQMPIFDGFKREGDLRRLGALRDLQGLLYRKRLHEAEAEVRRLYREAQMAQQEYEAQQANLRLAREALQVAQDQYEQGLISQMEYLQAQNTYAQARYAALQTLAQFHLKKLLLEQAARVGSSTQGFQQPQGGETHESPSSSAPSVDTGQHSAAQQSGGLP